LGNNQPRPVRMTTLPMMASPTPKASVSFLGFPMNGKSKLALRWTIDAMTGRWRSLWTFTTWTPQPLDLACEQWSFVARRLVKMRFKFVRVFELHKTHGLHVHLVADDFFAIEDCYRATSHTIFGNIDVKGGLEPETAGRYVAKYVTKAEAEPCLKGRRLWAVCGGDNKKFCHWPRFNRERVADIAYMTPSRPFLLNSKRDGYNNCCLRALAARSQARVLLELTGIKESLDGNMEV